MRASGFSRHDAVLCVRRTAADCPRARHIASWIGRHGDRGRSPRTEGGWLALQTAIAGRASSVRCNPPRGTSAFILIAVQQQQQQQQHVVALCWCNARASINLYNSRRSPMLLLLPLLPLPSSSQRVALELVVERTSTRHVGRVMLLMHVIHVELVGIAAALGSSSSSHDAATMVRMPVRSTPLHRFEFNASSAVASLTYGRHAMLLLGHLAVEEDPVVPFSVARTMRDCLCTLLLFEPVGLWIGLTPASPVLVDSCARMPDTSTPRWNERTTALHWHVPIPDLYDPACVHVTMRAAWL